MKDKSDLTPGDTRRVRRLVARTGSLFPWVRGKARQQLLAEGEPALERMLALFDWERRVRARFSLWHARIAYVILGLTFACLIAYLVGGATLAFLSGVLLLDIPVLVLIALGSGTLGVPTRFQALLANMLSEYEDLRVIGPMATALRFKPDNVLFPVKTRPKAMAALQRLLPRLGSDERDLLDAQQRGCLYEELKTGAWWTPSNPWLTVAILNALTDIGDTGALPYVRPLAARGVHSEIQRAAQRCLPILEAQAEKERQSQTLLRAAVSRSAAENSFI